MYYVENVLKIISCDFKIFYFGGQNVDKNFIILSTDMVIFIIFVMSNKLNNYENNDVII